MEITRRDPAECTPHEIASFCRLVRGAFGVGSGDRAQRIERSRSLIFLRDREALAGVAALRVPAKSHRLDVFSRAGVSLSGRAFPYELGWVVVDERFRGKGHSRLLVESALQAAGDADVFATSHSDNTPMHRTLQHDGFTPAGIPYFSGRHERMLVLFVRAGRGPW